MAIPSNGQKMYCYLWTTLVYGRVNTGLRSVIRTGEVANSRSDDEPASEWPEGGEFVKNVPNRSRICARSLFRSQSPSSNAERDVNDQGPMSFRSAPPRYRRVRKRQFSQTGIRAAPERLTSVSRRKIRLDETYRSTAGRPRTRHCFFDSPQRHRARPALYRFKTSPRPGVFALTAFSPPLLTGFGAGIHAVLAAFEAGWASVLNLASGASGEQEARGIHRQGNEGVNWVFHLGGS
jgi:hypothetical protein